MKAARFSTALDTASYPDDRNLLYLYVHCRFIQFGISNECYASVRVLLTPTYVIQDTHLA
jgi:hypothetical protein